MQPLQQTPTQVSTSLAGWMSTPPSVTHPAGFIGLGASTNPGNFDFQLFFWILISNFLLECF